MKRIKLFEDFYFMDPDDAFNSYMNDFKKISVELKDGSKIYSTYKFKQEFVRDGKLVLGLLKQNGVPFFVELDGKLTFYNFDGFLTKSDNKIVLDYFNSKFNKRISELEII